MQTCHLLLHLHIPSCRFKYATADVMKGLFYFAAVQSAETMDEERLARAVRQNTLEQGGTMTSLVEIALHKYQHAVTAGLRGGHGHDPVFGMASKATW